MAPSASLEIIGLATILWRVAGLCCWWLFWASAWAGDLGRTTGLIPGALLLQVEPAVISAVFWLSSLMI